MAAQEETKLEAQLYTMMDIDSVSDDACCAFVTANPGIDPNYIPPSEKDSEMTLTFIAVINDLKNTMRQLLSLPGADVNRKTIHGHSLIHVACKISKKHETVVALCEHEKLDFAAMDENNIHGMEYAAREGKSETVKWMIENHGKKIPAMPSKFVHQFARSMIQMNVGSVGHWTHKDSKALTKMVDLLDMHRKMTR